MLQCLFRNNHLPIPLHFYIVHETTRDVLGIMMHQVQDLRGRLRQLVRNISKKSSFGFYSLRHSVDRNSSYTSVLIAAKSYRIPLSSEHNSSMASSHRTDNCVSWAVLHLYSFRTKGKYLDASFLARSASIPGLPMLSLLHGPGIAVQSQPMSSICIIHWRAARELG